MRVRFMKDEAELRDRPPAQERITAMLEVIATLGSMRGATLRNGKHPRILFQ